MLATRLFVLSICVVMLQTSSGFAAEERGGNYPPPVDRAGSRTAQERLVEARQRSSAADSGLISSVANMRKEFEAGAEWQAALNELKQATAEFEKARLPIQTRLREGAAYKAAEADKKTLAGELEKLRAQGAGSDQITPVATKLMQANAALTKLEGDAVAADPALAGQRKRMVEANVKLTALRKQFDDSIKTSSGWQQAKQEQESAQKAVGEAQKEIREAQMKEAQLERERQAQVDEIDRRAEEARRAERERQREEDRRRARRRGF